MDGVQSGFIEPTTDLRSRHEVRVVTVASEPDRPLQDLPPSGSWRQNRKRDPTWATSGSTYPDAGILRERANIKAMESSRPRLRGRVRIALAALLSLGVLSQVIPAWAVPPDNDNRASAWTVGRVPHTSYQSTTEATLETNEPQPGAISGTGCPGAQMYATVWYYLEPPVDVPVAAKTEGSEFNTMLAIWRLYPDGSIRLLACNDDYAGATWSKAVFSAIAGQKFLFQVGSPDGSTGPLKFSLNRHDVPNDNIADPEPVRLTPHMTVRSTEGATLEGGEERKCHAIGATVWFRFSPLVLTGSEIYVLDTTGSDFRAVVSLYRLTSSTDPINIGCAERALTFKPTSGSTYLIQVGGVNEASGTLRFSVSEPVPTVAPSASSAGVNPKLVTNPDGSMTIFNDANGDQTKQPSEPSATVPPPPAQTVDVKARANPDGSTTFYNDRDHDGQVDPDEERVDKPPTNNVAPRSSRGASGLSVYNDNNVNGVEDPGERLFLLPIPTFNPKVRDNSDGSFTIYDDRNFDDSAAASEIITTTPIMRLRTKQGPDGSTYICNDRNGNGVCDNGEVIALIPPAVVDAKTSRNADGSTSVYNDRDSDGVNDPGEELIRIPGINPKVRPNPDGTVSVFNDSNGDDQPSPGELMVTSPILDPKIAEGPNSSIVIYNDRNHDGSPSEDEVIVTIPGPPVLNPRVATQGRDVVVYNDKNFNESPDEGEVIIRIPGLSPKIEQRKDGGTYVFNDSDEDGTQSQGEFGLGVRPGSNIRSGNDSRSSATLLSAPGTSTQWTYDATVEAQEVLACGIRSGTVWFKHEPASSRATFLEVESNPRFEPAVAIWEDTANGLVLLGCASRGTTGLSFSFNAMASKRYLIQVGASATGDDYGMLSIQMGRI